MTLAGLAPLWWCQEGSSKVTRPSDSWALHQLPRITLTSPVKLLSETCRQEGLLPWLPCPVAWPSQSGRKKIGSYPRKLPPRIPLKRWLVSVLNLSSDILGGYGGAGHPGPSLWLPPSSPDSSPILLTSVHRRLWPLTHCVSTTTGVAILGGLSFMWTSHRHHISVP